MSEDHYNPENCAWLQTQCLKKGQSLTKQKVINIIKHNNKLKTKKIQTVKAYFNRFGRFHLLQSMGSQVFAFAKLTT